LNLEANNKLESSIVLEFQINFSQSQFSSRIFTIIFCQVTDRNFTWHHVFAMFYQLLKRIW